VSRVEYYAAKGAAAAVHVGSGTKAVEGDSWSYNWGSVAAGEYTLTAVAVDNSGATTTAGGIQLTVNAAPNVEPTVAISSPANGTSYIAPANVAITATAGDADGTVAKVEFYQRSGTGEATLIGSDTSSPYAITWNSVADGAYTLTAVVTDNSGATTTSQPVAVTVVPNSGPTVNLTSPANSSVFNAPATVSLTADATDADGSVSSVSFYVNGGLIATDVTAPYSAGWSTSVAGSYTLTAVATDNLGKTTTSASVVITVNPEPAPAAPSALTARASKARIDLTWQDNSSNEAGFEVQRSTNGIDWTFLTTVDANVKTYRDSGVTAGITYYYKVKAFKGSLNSEFSAVASVRAR
jgi:hypothetical protein